MWRVNDEHKNFSFRVVSVCVSSPAFFFAFVLNPKMMVSGGPQMCFDTNLVTFLEHAHVEERRMGRCRCFPGGTSGCRGG